MSVYEPISSPACGCDDPALVGPLMSVSDAVEAGLKLVRPLGDCERVDLADARGRVLARPVLAQADMPGFDNSGMDGYAIRTSDFAAAPDAALPIAGVSAAGVARSILAPGTVMRIYTGAPVPRGADAVVMQEQTNVQGDTITLTRIPAPGENIRRQGEDMRQFDQILVAGRLLDARSIAACAGAGAGQVDVRRALRVALVLTGDELTPAGDALTGGAIWDVNSPMLRGLIDCGWAKVTGRHQVVDDRAALVAKLAELTGQVDIIVTSGGVSVGDRDHVKPALEALGARIAVSGVAIKPGKPVTLSTLGDTLVISLPGNPVSAFVTWQVFGAPLAACMAGLDGLGNPRRHVRADQTLHHKPGRCEYRPARITGYGSDGLEVVTTGTGTFSAQLGPLAESDGLVLIPAEVDRLEKGDLLEFLPFPA
jgi:molybdopterin molybdotransferase